MLECSPAIVPFFTVTIGELDRGEAAGKAYVEDAHNNARESNHFILTQNSTGGLFQKLRKQKKKAVTPLL